MPFGVGAADFAGSGVVHAIGGTTALVNLAPAAGALSTLIFTKMKHGMWDIEMTLNRALVELVAITAPGAWVEAWAAVVIGLIAGILVCLGVILLDKLRIDDPAGAFPVHGINGIWGLISLGLFADGTHGNYATSAPHVIGLFYGGGAERRKRDEKDHIISNSNELFYNFVSKPLCQCRAICKSISGFFESIYLEGVCAKP